MLKGFKKLENVKPQALPETAAPNVSKIPVERELTDVEIYDQSKNLFPEGVIFELSDANWKVRLSGVEKFKLTLDNLNNNEVKSQLLIRLLCREPGFKDNNCQVLKLRLEALNTIAGKFQLTSTAVSFCLNDIITLLADTQYWSLSGDVLTSFSEGLKLDYISNLVLEYAFSQQTNPKVQQESVIWLSNAIKKFGFVMQTKPLIEHLKKATGVSNPSVRLAVTSLLDTLYTHVGPQLVTFFENKNPANQINGEFEKHEGGKPKTPKRRKSNFEDMKTPTTLQQANLEDYSKSERVDISPQFTDSLLQGLTERDGKVRTEAINKLREIITEAKYITPNLEDAVAGIAQNLGDLNGRLVKKTLGLCETIALAMGPECKAFIRDFYPKMLQGLGDNKNYLRAAAIKCINTWGDTCGYSEFFQGEMIASALKYGSPALRVELWSWLAEKFPDLKNVPEDELTACLPYLYSDIEDGNPDVRKNASEAVIGFMIHLGYTNMLGVCEKLKVSSAESVKQELEKARANLMEKPGLKPGQQSSSSKASKSAQKSRHSFTQKQIPRISIISPNESEDRNEIENPTTPTRNEELDQTPTEIMWFGVEKSPFDDSFTELKFPSVDISSSINCDYRIRPSLTNTEIDLSPRKPSCNNSTNSAVGFPIMKEQDNLHSWITKMGSPNLDDAIIALQEVEMLLDSEAKKKEIEGMEVTVFSQLMIQLIFLNKSNNPQVATCYKSLFNVFLKVCSCPKACQKIPEILLQQIFENLLIKYAVEIENKKSGREVMFIKVIRYTTLEILHLSDHTHMICVLLRMLLGASESESYYLQLIIACLGDVIAVLPKWDTNLDYSKIVMELHNFLENFKQTENKPLMMCKLMLRQMVLTRGTYILTLVKSLPLIPQNAKLVSEITSCLEGFIFVKLGNHEEILEKPKLEELPKKLNEQFSDILKKIGNEAETRQGLNMLYEFKERNAEVNTDSFLSRSSKYFQDYVNRNLREIETLKRVNDDFNNKIGTHMHMENSMAVAASGEQSPKCIPIEGTTTSSPKIQRDAEKEDTQIESQI